jgi:hypothetical protein
MNSRQGYRWHIKGGDHITPTAQESILLGKTKAEMQEERGLKKQGKNLQPVHRPIEQIQLPGIGKCVKDKGRQAKNIEMK